MEINWLSHWDEDLADSTDHKKNPSVNNEAINYNAEITDEEINELFETGDGEIYKGHPCISPNEYKTARSNLDLTINFEDRECTLIDLSDLSEVGSKNNRTCPYCGESYYMENYSTITALYFPPIYKDGVNINPDRNTTTTHCTCMNCGKEFSYQQ